jgi:hypothetical protein
MAIVPPCHSDRSYAVCYCEAHSLRVDQEPARNGPLVAFMQGMPPLRGEATPEGEVPNASCWMRGCSGPSTPPRLHFVKSLLRSG